MTTLLDETQSIVNYTIFKDKFKEVESKFSIKLSYIDQIVKQGKLIILVSKSGYNFENRYFLSIGIDFQTEIIEAFAHKDEIIDIDLINELKDETENYFRQLQLVSTFFSLVKEK